MQIAFKNKARVDEKAEHTNVCEHFESDCNAVLKTKTLFFNKI